MELGLGRNEEKLLGWDWANQTYNDADRQGKRNRAHVRVDTHVDRLVC